MATLVLDLMDARPLLAFPGWAREAILHAVPAGWSTAVLDVPADGSGDGAQRTPPELLAEAADARVYVGYGVSAEFLRAAPNLEWVHSGAAGVASSLGPEMLSRPIRFTNSAGIHGPPVAETAIAAILYFARGLDLAVRAQREGRWGGEEFWGAESPVAELAASVVGVIGYGGIGRGVAERALALGSRVLALRRRDGKDDGAAGLSGGRIEVCTGDAALARIAARSDYLVLAAPETAETRGLIGRSLLSAMKPRAVLVNVARGGLVDEDALLDALNSGRLRGAALDVFREEPLPAGHPFFAHPRVLVTPHVSAATRLYWERQAELIAGNLRRFVEGRPLRNAVDKRAGY